MPNDPWDKEQHELYAVRIDEHLKRVDRRLELLEESIKSIHELALSVERLASQMETMSKTQDNMKDTLVGLEGRDGDKWRRATWYVGTTVAGIVLGAIAMWIGFA